MNEDEEKSGDVCSNESNSVGLIKALKATNDLLDLFYNNKFQEAYSIADGQSSASMMHAHAKAFLSFLYALLTLEKDELTKAKQDVEQSLQMTYKRRKQNSIVQNVTGLLWRADTCNYTDEELHAELVYGECNVMLGLLTFFGDQSIMALINGALRMTSANRCFKFCNESLKEHKQWESEEVKMQFESGVLNGFGIFNLVLSMIPKKIMRILSIAGFVGNKEVGLECIRKSTELKSGIRCRVSVLTIESFAMYIEQLMGINEIDSEWIRSLLEYWGEKFPKAVFILFYLAKYHLMKGDPRKAIEEYNECISIDSEWKTVHKICHWDLVWCYMTVCDWENAIKEANEFKMYSQYSTATIEYQIAVFKMMQMEESKNENLRTEVDELMKLVPTLKQRIGGKTIPQEKFICTRSSQYFDDDRRDAFVALMEFFYIWNFLCLLKTNELSDWFLRRIDEKLKRFQNEDERDEQIALLKLIKAVIYRNLDKDEEAVEILLELIDLGKVITKDTFIVPHSVLELGVTYLKMKKFNESKVYLEKVKNDDFDKYLNESIVNLRVASALRQLKYLQNSV